MTSEIHGPELLRIFGETLQTEVELGGFTTYRVGGTATFFVDVETDEDVRRLRDAVESTGIEVLVVGLGSNLLIADSGFDGLAVRLGGQFAEVEIDGVTVRAGAAAKLPVVARSSVAAGLTGFEWGVGVPGSVGGAVRMNAGGHGSDIAASLRRIRLLDLATGEDVRVPAADLDLAYRSSAISPHHVVLDAELELREGETAPGRETISEIVHWRRDNQPGGSNAGSVFTNPPGDSAGRLIEAAGLKGHRIGSAEVSPKHANFIQADRDGRAADVLALMEHVRSVVAEQTGIELEIETRLVGFGDEVDQR